MRDIEREIEHVSRLTAIPTILDVITRVTGMGFAAVARVTESQWVACSVLDKINLSGPIRCDRVRISQLLSNLLANALTYGDPTQPIRVTATSDGKQFDLSVSNFGEAIPRHAIIDLFKPFSRGKLASDRQGLGLGLYIASQIAQGLHP